MKLISVSLLFLLFTSSVFANSDRCNRLQTTRQQVECLEQTISTLSKNNRRHRPEVQRREARPSRGYDQGYERNDGGRNDRTRYDEDDYSRNGRDSRTSRHSDNSRSRQYDCAGSNAFGLYAEGGGCNAFGCYYPGGGCNAFGCYYPGGSCSAFGCAQQASKTNMACEN